VDGIWFVSGSHGNSISRNGITNNSQYGIYLSESTFNDISRNSVASNGGGIYIYDDSNRNNISENNITKNDNGIMLSFSSENSICHNDFISNTNQVYTYGSVNTWDNGVEGNYWSNYTGVDLDYDGIGESWYEIDGNDADHFPLMGMFSSFNTSLGYHVNVISNSTIEDFEYFESNSTIKMYVSGEEGVGFCRVSIPHVLINVSNISVIIDDGLTSAIYPNYTLYENGTHRWIYFAYPHSIRKIDIIPEFPSTVILLLASVFIAFVVILAKKKLSRNVITE